MSPRFSSTIFDPDANLVLLRARLCTAVDSMGRKPCVRNCSRKREGLLNGNAQQNPLCAASCVTKDIHISPRIRVLRGKIINTHTKDHGQVVVQYMGSGT